MYNFKMQKFMQYAFKEADKALKKRNVPVGCVIVKNNEIISKAHNKEFWHAEILCIQKAQKKLGKFLNNTAIFCTLEPCPMCEYAIVLAKIPVIIYSLEKTNNIQIKIEKTQKFEKKEYKKTLKSFFVTKRKQKKLSKRK